MTRANRLAGAFLLGIGDIVLLFILGEGISPRLSGLPYLQIAVFLVPQAAYFLLAAYLLSRKNPAGTPHDWVMLSALVAPPLLATIASALVESDKRAALEPAAVTVIAALGAWLGSLTARSATARPHPGTASALRSESRPGPPSASA